MESAAFIHSSSLTSFPCRGKATLRLARLNCFLLLQPTTLLIPRDLRIRISGSTSLRRRSFRLLAKAADENHSHDHHHHHNHDHHHQHCCSVELTVSNYPQKLLIGFARAIGWIRLANFLREHLHLCCSSAVLFIAAAACPYLIHKPYITPLQNAFMIVAFPLVGISASLDALMDIAGGKVNIHVLMALAAFASVFVGNALEGGLLLAMFNLAHIAEEFFTSRSMVDVKELKESNPDSALVIDVNNDNVPNFFDLSYKSVPVHNVEVGSYILVGAGEIVPVDCQVYQGNATITIEHLTGEVKPLEAKAGDRVPSGARNLDGRIIVKATKAWNESTLNSILQMTEEAHSNKPKLQRWLDEFGENYSKHVEDLFIEHWDLWWQHHRVPWQLLRWLMLLLSVPVQEREYC